MFRREADQTCCKFSSFIWCLYCPRKKIISCADVDWFVFWTSHCPLVDTVFNLQKGRMCVCAVSVQKLMHIKIEYDPGFRRKCIMRCCLLRSLSSGKFKSENNQLENFKIFKQLVFQFCLSIPENNTLLLIFEPNQTSVSINGYMCCSQYDGEEWALLYDSA